MHGDKNMVMKKGPNQSRKGVRNQGANWGPMLATFVNANL